MVEEIELELQVMWLDDMEIDVIPVESKEFAKYVTRRITNENPTRTIGFMLLNKKTGDTVDLA